MLPKTIDYCHTTAAAHYIPVSKEKIKEEDEKSAEEQTKQIESAGQSILKHVKAVPKGEVFQQHKILPTNPDVEFQRSHLQSARVV